MNNRLFWIPCTLLLFDTREGKRGHSMVAFMKLNDETARRGKDLFGNDDHLYDYDIVI